jgi:hypothetical protein
MFTLKKEERLAGNPLAHYVELLRLEKDYMGDKMWAYNYPDHQGNIEEYLGDALAGPRTMELLMKRARMAERPAPTSSELDKYKPFEAVRGIVEALGDHNILMVGEEHHIPQTRSIISGLLRELKKKGFTYFAAETFNNPEIYDTVKQHYPDYHTGTYTQDPIFSMAVRDAMKLGYKLVPYEIDEFPRGDNPAVNQNLREKGQAINLKERIIDKDPKAKVFVWAGRAHASRIWSEEDGVEVAMMGWHFQKLTGIKPFCVSASHNYELPTRGMEEPEYKYVTAKMQLKHPTVFRSANGSVYSQFPRDIDAIVFWPRVKLVDGRPDWMIRELGRKPYKLPAELTKGSGLRLVQAHLKNEPTKAVAVDQVMLKDGAPAPALMLPKGSFWIRTINGEGRELAKVTATIR